MTGIVTLEGSLKDINKRLEMDSETKIPHIFFTVYQHMFTSIYLLSSVLNTPYPPPDLLHPMQEKIQILPKGVEVEQAQSISEQPTEPTTRAKSKQTTEEKSPPTEKPTTATEATSTENAGEVQPEEKVAAQTPSKA